MCYWKGKSSIVGIGEMVATDGCQCRPGQWRRYRLGQCHHKVYKVVEAKEFFNGIIECYMN